MYRILLLLLIPVAGWSQSGELAVEKIMRDQKWIGTSPNGIFWSEESNRIYFTWNPDKNPGDSLYAVTVAGTTISKVTPAQRKSIPGPGVYNRAHTRKVYEKDGDLWLLDLASGQTRAITQTVDREYNPRFSQDESTVYFVAGNNLFGWSVASGQLQQLTDIRRGIKKTDGKISEQEKWLKADQLATFDVLRQRQQNKKLADRINKASKPWRPKEFYVDDKNVENITASPNGKFITFRLSKASGAKTTHVPNYVTESGFTEDIPSRTKVGAAQNAYEFFVYNVAKDTIMAVQTDDLPGITDVPAFRSEYARSDSKPTKRPVIFHGPFYSDDGQACVVVIRSLDAKTRWIASLNLSERKLKVLDQLQDDAWIGGPGSGFFGSFPMGWLADNKTLWFQSESSGYMHLYAVDVQSGVKRALTNGKFEVQTAELSRDKQSLYITTNEVHPGEKQFYKLSVATGKMERLTSMTGANEVVVSPDEKWLAIRYSYTNKPWELYLQENKPKAIAKRLTTSVSAEFTAYPWRDPEVLTITARDGAVVHARLYTPQNPNGAAVIFVHGAGYLQNAHKWWSNYSREYMFHNLLTDQGYTVLDMDYRGSAGYGRDWRTGISRFMGGKDLSDHLDGAAWLVNEKHIDPKRIGIYGGSYGGFITLMAMFTAPGTFAAGAALRPVTDWAAYNHPYTSSILNEPVTDSLAYVKSSPLYHAAGLQGALLICHGMVDTNVHFQDAVRLAQRLIELGKENWELAVYPVEDHGFVEPSSWTDEYKRILKLFEQNLR
ncbi:MAG: prolyl oligopeptidase family serine peptidase [Cyclobacteriaceae bacterium]